MSFPPADVFMPSVDGLTCFRPTVDALKVFHRADGGCDLSLRIGETQVSLPLNRASREHLVDLLRASPASRPRPDG